MAKKPVRLMLLTKPGCHLCDEAREILHEVIVEVGERGIEVDLEEVNILEETGLARMHSEEIPVVFIGRKRHSILRVDRDRLTTALQKASCGGIFG